ncbi:MAG TPA: DUF59 domain-containing protein [Acidobacteriaceae bacterium]
MTDSDLLDALRNCYDPVLHRNVVELGLVQSVALTLDNQAPGANIRGVAPRFAAHVVLRAPGNDELRNAQLRAQIENLLAGLPEISRSEIEMLPALFPILSREQV